MKIIPVLKEHWTIIILILGFIIINIINIENYGISWDEPIQRELGRANLDYLNGNNDNILSIGNRYYGSFYQTLNLLAADIIKEKTNLSDIAAHHCLGIFLSAIGLLFLYLLARKLFDNNIAIYSTIFLAFFPEFIAHTHYNTKDIPLANFSLITIYILYLAFKSKSYKYILAAGILLGITIDTKINALLILPIFFIPYILDLTINKKILNNMSEFKTTIKLIFTFAIVTAFSIFIFWPALWQSPDLFLDSIIYFLNHSWDGDILYLGENYRNINLPRHYPIIQLLIATPTITLIGLILGIYLTIKQLLLTKEKLLENSLVLSWFFLPVLMEIKPGTIVYDGIRQFFIILPALAILAAIGFNEFIKLLKNKYSEYGFRKVLPVMLLIILSINLVEIHPFEGSYVNEITRAIIPDHIENWFEIEYWGVSYREGVNWLNENAIENSTIYVPIASHLMRYYDIRPDLEIAMYPHYNPINYIMFFTRNPDLVRELAPIGKLPIYKITRYNSDLLYIYEINSKTINKSNLSNIKNITLRAHNGKYVCAVEGGGREVVANRDEASTWATFKLIDLGNNHFALQTYNGKYVCAVEGGGSEVVANRDNASAWETFKLIDLGNYYFALQTYNGKYVCAVEGGGREVIANSDSIGSWEKFKIEAISSTISARI